VKLVKFNSLDGMNRLNFTNVFRVVLRQKKCLALLFLVISLLLASCENKHLKTGYIDINQINKEFKLAIKYDNRILNLEKEITSRLITNKSELNILDKKIKLLGVNKKELPQELLQKFYKLQKEYSFQEDKARIQIQDSIKFYREKLNKKINMHVFNYAQKNNFDYVYSPAGTGTFMYADSSLNITKKVIYYLNSR